jgi:hypothetical protein
MPGIGRAFRIAAGVVAIGGLTMTAAPAAGLFAANPLLSAPDGANVILVVEGCGDNWHRNAWGQCVKTARIPAGPGGVCPPRFHLGNAHYWCWANY